MPSVGQTSVSVGRAADEERVQDEQSSQYSLPNISRTQGVAAGSSSPLARHTPDPGSDRARLLALIVLVVSVVTVAVLQQISVAAVGAAPVVENSASEVTPPVAGDQLQMMSKIAVKISSIVEDELEGDSEALRPFLTNVDSLISRPEDSVRAAVVAYELGLTTDAQDYLNKAGGDETESRLVLLDDAAYVRAVYSGEGSPAPPEGFTDRHGWFADLVTTSGDPGSAAHETLRAGGVALIAALITAAVLLVVAILGGVVMLVVVIVLIATGSPITQRWFVPPSVGGSVYLEAAAIFASGFLVLQLVSALLAQFVSPDVAMYSSLGLQWLLLGAAAWPLARGVSVMRWRADLGLVAPRGFFREIGSGLMLYLAWLPIYFTVAFVAALLLIAWQSVFGDPDAGPPTNPIVDLVSGADPLALVLFTSLAVIWAPVAEELIFRGCLYRHARSRVGFVLAAIVTAAAFGVMHGYHFIMLTPVISLGVMFALMREWRGSLIGPIFAHMLHNGTLVALLIVIFSIIG